MGFELGHGVNISHCLSQSGRRGAERRAWFTQADVECIAALGFDHIRIPVDEEQLWDEQGRREPETFEMLEQSLDWRAQAELRAVADLHIIRSHYFNVEANPLFDDPAEQDKFCALQADLSRARWYRDLLTALEKHEIAWIVWDYKGDFGIFDAEGWPTLVQRVLSDSLA